MDSKNGQSTVQPRPVKIPSLKFTKCSGYHEASPDADGHPKLALLTLIPYAPPETPLRSIQKNNARSATGRGLTSAATSLAFLPCSRVTTTSGEGEEWATSLLPGAAARDAPAGRWKAPGGGANGKGASEEWKAMASRGNLAERRRDTLDSVAVSGPPRWRLPSSGLINA
jgi:hypothetical protein